MIYVNQNQLDQVKYIIEQSTNGNHLLFPTDAIKRVAASPTNSEKNRTEVAEKILEQLILCDSLHKKKLFLAGLDKDTYEDVLRVYMNIVQNSVKDNKDLAH